MKALFALCLMIVFPLLSCNKSCDCLQQERVTTGNEYFEFGYRGGIAGVSKYFVISNGQLYPENTTHAPLSAAKYNQALILIDHFPEYLMAHPNTTFGCQGCADQFTVEIRRRVSGVVYYWYMDIEMDQLPVELRAYVQEVYDVSNQL